MPHQLTAAAELRCLQEQHDWLRQSFQATPLAPLFNPAAVKDQIQDSATSLGRPLEPATASHATPHRTNSLRASASAPDKAAAEQKEDRQMRYSTYSRGTSGQPSEA